MSQESLHYIQYLSGIISEEKFYEMANHLLGVDLSKVVEFDDNTALGESVACGGGACEIA